MSQERLMSGCQRKFSMENCKKESAHKVAKRNATKTAVKPRLRISIFQPSPGSRLLRIKQSGIASSTKVPPNLKQRESVKLKESKYVCVYGASRYRLENSCMDPRNVLQLKT